MNGFNADGEVSSAVGTLNLLLARIGISLCGTQVTSRPMWSEMSVL